METKKDKISRLQSRVHSLESEKATLQRLAENQSWQLILANSRIENIDKVSMDTMTYILGHIEKYLMRESFDLPEGLSIYGDTFVCDIAIQPLPCQENIFGYKAIIITSIKIRDINTPGDK